MLCNLSELEQKGNSVASVLVRLVGLSSEELFLAAQTIGAHKVKEDARRRRFEKWILEDFAG